MMELFDDPSHGRVEGTESVIACSNNYLGLTFDKTCIAAAKLALDKCGPGETLLLDADAHASLYDGARLSGAKNHPLQTQ